MEGGFRPAAVAPSEQLPEDEAHSDDALLSGDESAEEEGGVLSSFLAHGKKAAAVLDTGPKAEETAEEAELRKNREATVQGLLNGRAEWDGRFFCDFVLFLKQTHVLLGVFLCHELHPYSRCERLSVLLSNMVAGFGLALLLADQDGTKSTTIRASAAGVIGAIILAVWNIIQVQALTCSCVQEGSTCQSFFGHGAQAAAEGFGRGVACCCWFFSIFLLCVAVAVNVTRDIPYDVVGEAWILAQVYSWCLGVIIAFFLFLFAYWGCWLCCCGSTCCCVGEAGEGGSKAPAAYPHGPEYPDEDFFWEGDAFCSCCA